ncbi:hypothetical protein LSH36_963g00064 [Paralvinella palmiformis]|uniref:THAP-type domain-containing protein n=1 Tax=Paralvinella palmiformis TaxID=53620 RepID=A0AAD9IYF2_9ANNE|nr:hypothetical protein LSH36_963g00064 [Paralvinella palmiformis]
MPSTCFSVPECSNRGGHQFPSDRNVCKLWVIAIRRVADKTGKLWRPSQNSLVCPSHFKADDYKTTNVRGFPTAGKKMRLKDGAVPSKFFWTEKSANVDRQLRAERRQLQHDIIVDQDQPIIEHINWLRPTNKS